VGRLSQAISEGDGISIIPLLEGDVAELARRAEAAGAEAVAVWSPGDVPPARSHVGLPVLLRRPQLELGEELRVLRAPDADGCVLAFSDWPDVNALEQVHAHLVEEEVDCAIDVRNEEELGEALGRVDPEIVLVSERDLDPDEEPLERVLDLLPDVPAGKLVIAETPSIARDQVVALERAGVDAILVQIVAGVPDFGQVVEELVGGARPS
jgi:indole-3-glycerol phosphate synthase